MPRTPPCLPQPQCQCLSVSQAFSAWIHVCAIRLFVESILRYGLPPQFLAVLMKPAPKTVPKLRKALASTFGAKGAQIVRMLYLRNPCYQYRAHSFQLHLG